LVRVNLLEPLALEGEYQSPKKSFSIPAASSLDAIRIAVDEDTLVAPNG